MKRHPSMYQSLPTFNTLPRALAAILLMLLVNLALPTRAEDEAAPSILPSHQRENPWFDAAAARVASRPGEATARNVVLFIGDGMGISTITAARILAGQQLGGPGEDHSLSFERFPFTGLAKTYNTDSQTPDSAGTMSAIITGAKTRIGMFGIDDAAQRGECASGQGRELLSLLDIAELAGRATGVVSTARLTHATPGATYAKTVDRDWEDDGELPAAAAAAGCTDIARQFLDYPSRINAQFGPGASDGIEVALGGGRRHFLPQDKGGSRADGRNLVDDWQAQYPDGQYVGDAEALAKAGGPQILGLFADSHMDYRLQRDASDGSQPSLTAMTLKALDILRQNDSGYLLVVEAGRIDHAHHAGNAANALTDTIELAEAAEAVATVTSADDTLILVTADHSHVFTIAGYPRRGNPILGKVIPAWSDDPLLDANGMPYTTLGYMNGRGFRDHGQETNADSTYAEPPRTGRQDIRNVDTTAPGYHQEALIPSSAETHGGEDVAVYASGPGAARASGSYEQNLLFHVMLAATGWDVAAAQRLAARAH